MLKRTILFATFAFLLLYSLISAAHAIPGQISYQGVLKDNSGTPLTGSYSITFKIYDAATGGTTLWTETRTVSVEAGLYNIQLGSSTALSSTVFDGSTRYLGIKVESDAEMTPRVVLVTVPYAYRAAIADAALSSITTIDADTVDGFHANSTPTANNLFPLNSSGYLRLETSSGYSGYFTSSSSLGQAVIGYATASGNNANIGGRFGAAGNSGKGLQAVASATGEATNTGGYFSTNGNQGTGIISFASGNSAVAVDGRATSDGAADDNYGAMFWCSGGAGYGMWARADHTSGTNYGAYGESWSPSGYGVYGKGTSNGIAVAVDTLLWLKPRSGPPSGDPTPGLMFYNSDDGKLWIHGAATWEVVVTSSP